MFKRVNENKESNRKKRSKFYDYKPEENKSFIINQFKNKKSPDLEKVKQLLKQRCFSNLRDTKGRSILEAACQNPYITLEMLQLLIDNDNPVTTENADKLLNDLCRNEAIHFDIIKWLVEKHTINLNAMIAGSNSLYGICSNKEVTLDIIKYLIEKGASPSPATELLKHLCHNDNANLEIIKYFVEELKADPNERDIREKNLFDWVCDSSTVTLEVIKYVIDKGANIEQHVSDKSDQRDNASFSAATDLLHRACNNGNVDLEIIKYFVENHKADLKATVDERNLLHWACASKTVTLAVIKYLIENKVDLKQNDTNEEMPIHLFFKKYLKNDVSMADKEIIHYLLDQDIDVDAIDCQLQTILHVMSRSKEMDLTAIYKVIEKSKRSTLILTDEDMNTPLEVAYRSNKQDAFTLLLLLRWEDVGLEDFDPALYDDQQPDKSNSDPIAFYEKRQAMRQLVNAAQKSKAAFEEELDRAGYLNKFPDECLKNLVLDGCLSKNQLVKLKEKNIFVKDNVKYFPESTKNNVFNFFCWMKVVNKDLLQPGWKIPKRIQDTTILREILHNDAQSIREIKEKENSRSTIGLGN